MGVTYTARVKGINPKDGDLSRSYEIEVTGDSDEENLAQAKAHFAGAFGEARLIAVQKGTSTPSAPKARSSKKDSG